jgi:polyisoprenyl-phosphate glycosyltransferase
MVVVLFLGGIQLFFIGVLGEYLGRIFNETKARPLYFVNAYVPSAGATGLASTLDAVRRDLAKPAGR